MATANLSGIDEIRIADMTVRRFGLGTAPFTGPGVWDWPADRAQALSVIRRALAGRRAKGPAVCFRKGAVRIDSKSRTVWINDKLIANLPSRRFETLFLLMQTNAEVPWKELVQKIWGPQGARNDLEKAIQRLRADLGPERHRIRTTRRGYELTG